MAAGTFALTTCHAHTMTLSEPNQLHGASVHANDVRAGAVQVLAGWGTLNEFANVHSLLQQCSSF